MSPPRRTRLSVFAAAASGALVVAMTGTAMAADHPDRPTCSDIDLEDAQAALDAVAPSGRHRLDSLCESIPTRQSADTEEADDPTPATTPAAVTDEESAAPDSDDGDRNCVDVDSQADPQAALEASSNDKEGLDADDDGIACEDCFDTEDQQVAVYPNGGVATGGAALS